MSKRMSRLNNERWKDNEYRATISKQSKEQLIEQWQNPEYIAKLFASCKRSPNIPETLLLALTPENVTFVGNGKWWRTLKIMTADGLVIKHKNPDFLVKGQKKIIEFNGTYWHKDDYPDGAYHEAWANIGYK